MKRQDFYEGKAFDAYTSLSSDARNDVGGIPEVAARLNAWATANGKSFTADNGFAIMSVQTIQSEYSVATVGVTIIAAVVVVGFISFIAIRKRKTNI